MKLSACRIENYRSIQDSGWVELGDIAVVVGKNESGKTSLLSRRVKSIMNDLSKKKLADLSATTVESFRKVIVAVNAMVAGWKKGQP